RCTEAVPHLRAAVAGNPFDLPAARALCQALRDSGDPAGPEQVIAACCLLARAAPGVVPREGWFAGPRPTGDARISIVILCCNEVETTRLCLESVLRHTRPPYELVLVDNGSADGTPALLDEMRCRTGPVRVEIVRNEDNRGFAAGSNHGLAA